MNKQRFQVEIKWAWFITLLSLAWSGMEKLLGFHSDKVAFQPVFNLLLFFPICLFYILALAEKKKRTKPWSFKKGIQTGMLLTFFATLLAPLVQWISFTMISPNYFQEAIHFRVENKLNTLEEAKNYYNLTNTIIQSILITPFYGFFASLLASYIHKTRS